MKVIIPVAGKATRLRPLTHTVPKPLLPVAGKPMIEHILDKLKQLPITEYLFVTGPQGDQFRAHMALHHPGTPSFFVEQKIMDGPGGAIRLVLDRIDEPVLIIYADTLFDADLDNISATNYDGIIWAQEVEEYQRFGVIVTDEHHIMRRIVEKPKEPISRLANIGMYYMHNHVLFRSCMEEVLRRPPAKGSEYYPIDAFQMMADQHAKIFIAPVEGWYDCGTHEALLETNATLLKQLSQGPQHYRGSTIIPPVHLDRDAVIEESTIGPNVMVAAGARILRSNVSDAIIAEGAAVEESAITRSILGRRTQVLRMRGRVIIGDDARVHG